MNYAVNIISGRWKAQIIYSISEGYNRFHLLKAELANVSEQVLGRQLNDLESHGVLMKMPIPNSIPTGIEYLLTEKGQSLVPVLKELCSWGKIYEKV